MPKAYLAIALLVCGSGLLALTGHGDSGPVVLDTVAPAITLLAPNGGEIWYIGFPHDIMWEATDTNMAANPISLWYSVNGGASYTSIVTGTANDGSESWTVPAPESNNARVKIQALDSFGNLGTDVSAAPFSLLYLPPMPPDGVNVDVSNGEDAVLTWLPVTHTVYGTPITPDGYIVLFNETPYENAQFYYFLGETAGLTYTHHRVALFRSQMFYRVLAYVDPDGRITALVDSLKARPESRISLAEFKSRLQAAPGGGE